MRRALDCLLAQDYDDFELVISDNASTDSTRQICQEYAAKDSRIKLNLNPHNIGIVANFALVLERATGQYFMWASHDDRWEKTFLGSMVRELETHPEASVVMSAIERCYERTGARDIVRFTERANPNVMTPFQLSLALALGSPHHLFFFGLFRTGFLKRAYANFPKVIAGDRLLLMQIAMSSRLRYVDQVLHSRHINEDPIPDRYQHEEFGRIWRDPSAYLKKDLATGPYLLRSKIIPWQRKLWIPIIVIWPRLKRLYHGGYRFLYWLAGKIIGRGGRRKNIARYL